MTLDEFITQRYGPSIDQIREMDADLADAIRAGVAIKELKRLIDSKDGRVPNAVIYLWANDPNATIKRAEDDIHCHTRPGELFETMFDRIKHLLDQEALT